jgi:cytochrome c553
MTRLILFLVFLVSLVCTMTLISFGKFPRTNQQFNLSEAQKLAENEKLHGEASAHGNALSLGAVVEEEVVAEEAASESTVMKVVEIPLDTPELQMGYEVYHKKGKCTTCHGLNGEGRKSQKAPKLAAQYDWYLQSQLENMKNQVRVNKVMEPYLKNLTAEDFKNVALYLSKIPGE